jgi:hypothetical protein
VLSVADEPGDVAPQRGELTKPVQPGDEQARVDAAGDVGSDRNDGDDGHARDIFDVASFQAATGLGEDDDAVGSGAGPGDQSL